MAFTRRSLLRLLGVTGVVAATPGPTAHAVIDPPNDEHWGVLVDTTACIGCRKCEWACNQANGLSEQTLESFEDDSVFAVQRRPDATHFTVVNSYLGDTPGAAPVRVKVQCMHCNQPACASACLVSALVKQPNGAVSYEPWRCMGCRYCMVVCPFGMPAYEYRNPTTPRVRKCGFCAERVTRERRLPACVEICPPQCLTFGPRAELVQLAHQMIRSSPNRYVDHVYGEHEVGGTSWMYLAGRPFAELGFPELPDEPPAVLTEELQHGIFAGFIPPIALFAVLGTVMAIFRTEKASDPPTEGTRR